MVKALVVEDEEDIRNLLVEQLLDKSCHVRRAANGALVLMRAQEEIPDIIFVDIVMPVMDGILFVSELRKHPATERIPVVLVSAISLPGLRERVRTLGVNHYLAKPWNDESLEHMLRINNEWEIPTI